MRPVRHWLAERVRAHIFLCYLAFLLLSLLHYHLRDTDFTPDKALEELSILYKVCLRDSQKRFRISRTVPLTKTQETIIKAVDRNLLNDLA
jgi:transposase